MRGSQVVEAPLLLGNLPAGLPIYQRAVLVYRNARLYGMSTTGDLQNVLFCPSGLRMLTWHS
jgi:hypothetical protein